MATPPRKTKLYDSHAYLGGKMVDFHGFELPIWYSSIQEEHVWTRKSSGIFDVSHMGIFRFKGENVRTWLSSVSTQDFSKFSPGRCGYTHFLDYEGYIIDDMIFAICDESEVLGVPNSSMIISMEGWLSSLLPDDGSISIDDFSEETSIIALQGPESINVIHDILGSENALRSFSCQEIKQNKLGISGWIQGTGYTGEKGVEIFVDNDSVEILWDVLTNDQRVRPVGLGARDTLRLEKGYLLSGQDFLWPTLGDSTYPFPPNFLARNIVETSVPFGLDLNHEFIGKEATIAASKSGTRLRGMKCLDRGPSPRPGHRVLTGNDPNSDEIGFVTSGGPSPSMDMAGIAIGYLDGQFEGTEVWIETSIRKRVRASVSKLPFI